MGCQKWWKGWSPCNVFSQKFPCGDTHNPPPTTTSALFSEFENWLLATVQFYSCIELMHVKLQVTSLNILRYETPCLTRAHPGTWQFARLCDVSVLNCRQRFGTQLNRTCIQAAKVQVLAEQIKSTGNCGNRNRKWKTKHRTLMRICLPMPISKLQRRSCEARLTVETSNQWTLSEGTLRYLISEYLKQFTFSLISASCLSLRTGQWQDRQECFYREVVITVRGLSDRCTRREPSAL